ncbi:hypothetical protein BSZ35_15965 [Salinibacter sp. 10B]|nr:hypothetical protein BSZ35_15965 [Salinibacter sp. 10B]
MSTQTDGSDLEQARGSEQEGKSYLEGPHSLVSRLLTLILGSLAYSLVRGRTAPMNPWGATTPDWGAVTTPPILHNYRCTPVVTSGPYAFHCAQPYRIDSNRHVLRP